MKLKILLFAAIRSKLGSELIDVQVPDDACARDLLRIIGEYWPQVADLLPSCRVAIDQRFADPDERLRERVEIAIIPPVSGGHDGAPRSRISDQPLEIATVIAAVSHRGAGGINSFIGNVRGKSKGHEISHLEYEAYEPMALRSIDTIIDRIEAELGGARLAIHHRRGRLQVGETAVIIAASAPHRAAAFEACRAAIEALKRDVPIWKREVTTTGETWFGRGP